MCYFYAALVVQTVKRLPAMQETWDQSLGREDPREKEMATHSSILAWEISWTEKPGGLNQVVQLDLVTKQKQTMENTQCNNCVFH